MAKILSNCIQKPVQNVTAPTFVPANSSKRSVTRGDSFGSIAKALGIDPWGLVCFNFPSVGQSPSQKGAREVNWYLQEYLGCREVTRDQKNYVFHEGMKRQHIYIPISVADFPGTVFTATMPLDAWFGLAMKTAKYNGQLFAVEVEEEHQGAMFSFDHYEDWFSCSVKGKRYGAQLSALPSSVGLVAYIATGVKSPNLLNDHAISGVDFSLQLGPLSKALKGMSTTWKLGKMGKALVKPALTAAEWEKSREIFKQVITNLDIDVHSPTAKLHVIDLPLGVGLDASIYYLKAKMKVDYLSIKVGRQITITDEEVAVP